MNIELVQVKKGIVFTTSQNISDETGKAHRTILRDIDKLISNLSEQDCSVKQYFSEASFLTDRNREFRCFNITRDGFVLLAMGYNKEKFFKFKIDYINAFNSMEKDLKNRSIIRSVGIETRKILTEEIVDSGENERMHGKGISNYTRLLYKIVGIKYVKPPKGIKFRDGLPPEDLNRVNDVEGMMKILIKSGKVYSEIKEDLNNLFIKKDKLI